MRWIPVVFFLSGVAQAQEPAPAESEGRIRVAARLEGRFAALPPFTAEYQCLHILPDGKEEPGSEIFFFLDFLSMTFYSRLSVLKDDGKRSVIHSILEKEEFRTWLSETEAYGADVSDLLLSARRAIDETRVELDRLLPPTPEDADPALCRSLMLNLDVHRKKGPDDEEGGGFQFSFGVLGPPALWLADARSTRDARMTEEEKTVTFRFPKDEKKFVVDRETGLLLLAEAKDYDGRLRRLVRRSFTLKAERPAFTPPPRALFKPIPLGELKGYIHAYLASLDGGVRRVFHGWDRLGDRQSEIPELIAGWTLRYLELWKIAYLDSAADAYVKRRLDGGDKLDDLTRAIEPEARKLGEMVAQQGEFGTLCRQLLKNYLEQSEGKFKAQPDHPNREPFTKALHEGMSPERVFPKVSRVTEADLQRVLRGALKRVRQL
jgi:hypothetical protein